MPRRIDNTPVMDSSVLPRAEVDLVPIVLTSDSAATQLDFTNGANFRGGAAPASEVMWVLLYSDGDFVDGADNGIVAANNLPRVAQTYHQISTIGRSSWYLKRINAVTTTIRGKVLLAP